MAHFAELDENNVVLRVVVACNQDIANNGGEQSDQAAQHFTTVVPLSNDGVKWIQTSYSNSFRKQYASADYTYDSIKNIFIRPQPFSSWSLDDNSDWQAPISYPSIKTHNDNEIYVIFWDETNQRWLGNDYSNNTLTWSPQSSSWSLINS